MDNIFHFVFGTQAEAFEFVVGDWSIIWEKEDGWHALVSPEDPGYDAFIDLGLRHGLLVAIED